MVSSKFCSNFELNTIHFYARKFFFYAAHYFNYLSFCSQFEVSIEEESDDELILLGEEDEKLLDLTGSLNEKVIEAGPILIETAPQSIISKSNYPTCAPFKSHKKKKLHRKLAFHIQCIVQSFFIIYLLGIWDIADVYQYCRMQNWENTNMNLFLANNSQYEKFLGSLNTLQGRLNVDQLGQQLDESLMGGLDALATQHSAILNSENPNVAGMVAADGQTTIRLFNNYFNKFSNNFYRHAFYHQASVEFKRDIFKNESSQVNSKQLTATTKVKAFFVIKLHSQMLFDLMIIIIICVIIFNLDVIDSALGNYSIENEMHQILNL